MQIEVGPARRPGSATIIYDGLLHSDDVQVDPAGGFTLTIDATGIKDSKSLYRYRLRFQPSEAVGIVRALVQRHSRRNAAVSPM